MSITLTEARFALRESVLHAGNSFLSAKLDIAIIRSGMRMMREGGIELGLAQATTRANNRALDFADTTPIASGGANATDGNFNRWLTAGNPFITPGAFNFTTATYVEATRTLTSAGTFSEYVFTLGDKITLDSGSIAPGFTAAGTYTVESHPDDNTIILTSDLTPGSDSTASDWVGKLFSGLSTADKWSRIQVISMDNLTGEYDKGHTSGHPEVIAWANDTVCWIYPEPDLPYTIFIPYHQPIATSTFSPGTHDTGAWSAATTYAMGDVVTHTPAGTAYTYRSLVDANLNNTPLDNLDSASWSVVDTTANKPVPANARDVVLNVPDQWAYEWLATGGRSALLRGAPGHPDYGEADREFEELIMRVKDATASTDGAWYVDPTSNLDTIYGPQGLIDL